MYITKIIIDSREQDRIEKLQKMYCKFNPAASITIEELVTGDICFFTDGSDKPILTCEIKEKNDYIDSMISGHLFHQCDRLLDETNPFLCICWKQDFSHYDDFNMMLITDHLGVFCL
jgi:ERCC4-type nuclease